jgi:putative transposase
VVMMYVRYPLSLRNVEDLLFERGIAICRETVRQWWNRFGPMFAGEIRRRRVQRTRAYTHWKWRFDEVYVKINGEMCYLWRAVDHAGEVLESFVTKERDKAAALKFIKTAMKRHGRPHAIVTDGLRSYGAALKEIGSADRQEIGRWKNNRAENSHLPFPTTRASHAAISGDESTPQVQLGSCLGPQPLQPGAPSRQPPNLHGETRRRAGGVAVSPGLNAGWV